MINQDNTCRGLCTNSLKQETRKGLTLNSTWKNVLNLLVCLVFNIGRTHESDFPLDIKCPFVCHIYSQNQLFGFGQLKDNF